MPTDELIDIVDENNQIIRQDMRSIAHELGFLHRLSCCVIYNHKNELLLQKRAEKITCPHYWDLSVAEHLKPGESYSNAATRGLREELGITVPLKLLRPAHLQRNDLEHGVKEYFFVEVYCAEYDGQISYDPKEVAEAGFYNTKEIAAMLAKEKFTPWFLKEWEYLKKGLYDSGA